MVPTGTKNEAVQSEDSKDVPSLESQIINLGDLNKLVFVELMLLIDNEIKYDRFFYSSYS